MAQYEHYALAVEARLEQLARERERGVMPLLAPLPSVRLEEHDCDGTVACVACRRDHHVEPGMELTTADGAVLCWTCARAGAPLLAAHVLADAADHAERAGMDVCETANGFLIDLIRERGSEDRAVVFGQRVGRIQSLLRDARRCGDTDPVCWLELEAWLEQLR